MNCSNCGLELKENETVCPSCQNHIYSGIVVETNANEEPNINQSFDSNSKYEEYKEVEKLNEKYGFNKLLIFSILELVCCSQVFGLIGIILLFLKLKPAIAGRNFEEADKWEKNIRILLIIGIILGLLLGIFQLIVNFVPVLIELIALA